MKTIGIAFLVTLVSLHTTSAFLDIFKRTKPAEVVAGGFDGIRGVPPSLQAKFETDLFVCDAGKNVLRQTSINDGYCDCNDGTDEPGTSACSNGVFYCANKGYKMMKLTSSRVDDMVCDCCDGSDEAHVQCPNTCGAHAEREKAALEMVTNNYRTGSAVRNELIQTMLDKERTLNAQLKQQTALLAQLDLDQAAATKDLDARVSSFTVQIEQSVSAAQATVQSLLGLEQADLPYSAALVAALAEALDLDEQTVANMANLPFNSQTLEHHDLHDDDMEHMDTEPDVYGEGVPAHDEHETVTTPSCDIADMTGCRALSPLCAWAQEERVANLNSLAVTMIRTRKAFAEAMVLRGFYQLENSFIAGVQKAGQLIAESGMNTCPAEFEALPQHCDTTAQLKNAIEIIDGVQSLTDADPEVQRLRSLQNTMRSQHAEAQSSKSSAELALQEINKHRDFLEFLALKSQCFDVVDGKFSYSVCPMENVKQKEVDGGSQVTLGNFDRFEESADKGYTLKLHFAHGQHCHAFGARRAEVTVVCAEKNALKSASEPSTCAYALLLESPAACNPRYALGNGIQL